jgi:hypothetical protein
MLSIKDFLLGRIPVCDEINRHINVLQDSGGNRLQPDGWYGNLSTG